MQILINRQYLIRFFSDLEICFLSVFFRFRDVFFFSQGLVSYFLSVLLKQGKERENGRASLKASTATLIRAVSEKSHGRGRQTRCSALSASLESSPAGSSFHLNFLFVFLYLVPISN